MVIKADSPATFAEKYIIESIWNNHFPQGSILPAERELSELIGVTRTTLREVLQRLARDGWLTIQHGKPTRVNNYMYTSGLSILDTLITLDGQDVQSVLKDLLSARTDISSVYMRYAIKGNPEESAALIAHVIEECESLLKVESFADFIENSADKIELTQEVKKIVDKYGKDDPELCEAICRARAFNYYDYRMFQGMATKSGNTLYVLTINGLRKIYTRVGGYYFMSKEACELALAFYREMQSYCDSHQPELVADRIRKYGRESGTIWYSNRIEIARYLYEEGYQAIREKLSSQYNLSNNEPNIQVWNVALKGDRSLTLRYVPHNRIPLSDGHQEVLKHMHRLWGFDVTLEEELADGRTQILGTCPARNQYNTEI